MKKLLVLATTLLVASCGYALPQTSRGFLRDVTFQITSGSGSCSATAIGEHTLITAKHCEALGNEVVLANDGKELGKCVISKKSEKADVMLMECDFRFAVYAEVSRGDATKDQPVAVAGYPMALIEVLTFGYWQGRVTDSEGNVTYQVTTAEIAPGSSGGGLFIQDINGQWKLIGVTSQAPMVQVGLGGSLITYLSMFVDRADIEALLK